jgi:FKBP-type peptidyl-prolyl cis-trans isomerase
MISGRLVWFFCLLFNSRSLALQQSARARRSFLTSSAQQSLVFLPLLLQQQQAQAFTDEDLQNVNKLITGVQYRDDYIGGGSQVKNDDTVVMHVKALRRDGSVFLDTRETDRPLLHKFGTIVDYEFFGGNSSKRSQVTIGLEDGILAAGNNSMRLGGVRRIVVPSPLAYGHAGVSRYDALQMGLLQPIPRDELLRYEVELLRCIDVPIGDGNTAQACCTEPNYPCKTGEEN